RVITGAMASTRAGGKVTMLFAVTTPLRTPPQLQGSGRMPRETEIPIAGCVMLGDSGGNPASSRVDVRLTKLACVMPDKGVVEEEIDGYVTDVDGTAGIVAKITRHESEAVFKAGLTAILQDASALIGLARSTLVISPAAGTIQPFQGAQTGLQQLTTYFLQQADFLLSTLWVESAQPVRLILTKGVAFDGLPMTTLMQPG